MEHVSSDLGAKLHVTDGSQRIGRNKDLILIILGQLFIKEYSINCIISKQPLVVLEAEVVTAERSRVKLHNSTILEKK